METQLKRILRERGIKQTWLIEKTRLNQSWVHKLVTGKSTPNVYDAQKIAHALGVSVEKLWPLEEEKR